MMKQVQKMQAEMQKTQAGLGEKTIEATVAGGRVTVTANGLGDITAIKIAKEIVDPTDIDTLQDLVLSGVQQAQIKVKELASGEMGKITGGMGLPPGLGF